MGIEQGDNGVRKNDDLARLQQRKRQSMAGMEAEQANKRQQWRHGHGQRKTGISVRLCVSAHCAHHCACTRLATRITRRA